MYISNLVFAVSNDSSGVNIQQGFHVFYLQESVGNLDFLRPEKEEELVCYSYIVITMYTNYRGHSIHGVID